MIFDPDTPLLESEMASISLALGDLSVTAIRDQVLSAVKSRTHQSRPKLAVDNGLFQHAVLKSAHFILLNQLTLRQLRVRYISPGSARIFTFAPSSSDTPAMTCDYYASTSKQNTAHLTFAEYLAQRDDMPSGFVGCFEKPMTGVLGIPSLVWTKPRPISLKTETGHTIKEEREEESFTYEVAPVPEWLAGKSREYRIVVKIGLFGKLTITYKRWVSDKQAQVKAFWYGRIQAEGEPDDLIRAGELGHILWLVNGYRGRPETAVRLFEQLGLKNTTNVSDEVDSSQTSAPKVSP
jgi:hypothetical protein